MDIKKINYKSDFLVTLQSDTGWTTPFCIRFWTNVPTQCYCVCYDGKTYTRCRQDDDPTKLVVLFDDHGLGTGILKMQMAWHAKIDEFPSVIMDEVMNQMEVIVDDEGTEKQVELALEGETSPEILFNLPAYANEQQRIQNELQRQQNEAERVEAELQREQATAAAVEGAENVNAQLAGNILTVTNRQGVSTSVNTKGEQGVPGPVGPEGPQGQKGVSVTGLVKTGETEMDTLYNVTFSDGTTQAVTIPKGEKGDTGTTGPTGPQGPQGPQGQTGVSITGLVKTGETETDTLYNVTFSNGTTQAVAIPKGAKGDQGPAGPQGPQGPMGDVAVITPEQQAAFTMYSEPGQNTNGPMTQKAATDALENKIEGQSENDSTWDFALSDADGNIVFCIKDGHIITKNFKSSTLTIDIANLDKENCAYAVTDSNGNMAFVITEDGHLVTKNFNSRNVSTESLAILAKLANLVTKFNGKTMAVIGDSISTYTGYTPSGWRVYYPTGNVNNVSATYWHQVATALGMTPLNCAYSASYATGDSTQTEVSETHEQGECAGCSEVRIASLTRDGNTPDIVLILLGTNDYNAGKALGSWTEHSAISSEGTINQFSSAYALMLHKIKTALPNTRIFCCTILQRNFSFPEKTISVKDYNDVIKKMASIFGCDVIDTYACGISRYNIGSYTVDGAIHPNEAGHKLIADKIITELISKY